MLLKSVGQEEKVVEETMIEELDPNLKQCDGNDDMIDTVNVVEPDEFQENFVESNVTHDTLTSQSQETQITGEGLDSVVVVDKDGLTFGEKKDDANQEGSDLVKESIVNELQEDLSICNVESGNASSLHNLDVSFEECQENPQEVPETLDENPSDLSKNFHSSEPENLDKIDDANMEGSTGNLANESSVNDLQEDPSEKVNASIEECQEKSLEVLETHNENTNVDKICDDANQEGSNLENESCDNEMQEDPFVSKVDSGNAGSLQTMDASIEENESAIDLSKSFHSNEVIDLENESLVNELQEGLKQNVDANVDECGENTQEVPEMRNENASDVFENVDKTCDDANSHLGNESFVNELQEDVSVSKIESGNAGSLQNVNATIKECQENENASESDISKNIHMIHDDANQEENTVSKVESGNAESSQNVNASIEECRENPQQVLETLDENASEPKNIDQIHDDGNQEGSNLKNELQEDSSGSDINNVGIASITSNFSAEMPTENISNKDELAVKISGLSHVGDETQSSEPNAVSMDQDFTFNESEDTNTRLSLDSKDMDMDVDNAPDSPKNVEPDAVTDVESSKISSPDTTVARVNIVTEDHPRSPILGVSLLHDTNEQKVEVGGSYQKGTPEVDSAVNHVLDGSLPVVKNDAEKSVHCDVGPSEQITEKTCPLSNENDTNQVVQSEDSSAFLDKPQVFSFSDTKSIQLSQSEKDKVTKGTVENSSPIISSSSATKEEKSFTFEVTGQIDIQNMKVSSVTSSDTLLDPNKLHQDSLVTPQKPSATPSESGAKKTSERKPRRKSVTKKKETTPTRNSRTEKSPPLTGNENRPDLNNPTSIPQHSFTDNQQIQLRAQILVYGSLISGMSPEEPHMIAAFGQSDSGRKAWEAAWRACIERVNAQKSVNTPHTPLQSRSGNKDSDQGIKIGSNNQNKPIVSPMIPISSPLWNISTPQDHLQPPRNVLFDYRQTASPLNSYQNPRIQNLFGQNPYGQWVASSPVTTFAPRFSSLPITESVKLTTVKESSSLNLPVTSLENTASPIVSSESKKRKKVAVTSINSQTPVLLSTPVSTHGQWVASSPVTGFTPRFSSLPITESVKVTTVKESSSLNLPVTSVESTVSPIVSPESKKRKKATVTSNSQTPVLFSTPVSVTTVSTHGQPSVVDQNMSKIEESKVQATEAAVQAAAAVTQCQEVWSRLERQKSSNLVSDDEAKLASSAVSIAAAASVAKVAAFAAKIASNVAEQAKSMADEVISSQKTTTPLKSDRSTSVISVAREAARRRIEAASTASKHAENLDAILKAAELAAEAVSQAGKIVAMGNPLSISELVEAGPEGYWKTSQGYSGNKQNAVEGASSDKKIQTLKHGLSLQDDSGGLGKNGNDRSIVKGLDLSKNIVAVPELDIGQFHTSDADVDMPQSTSHTWKDNDIKDGCLVEVYKDDKKKKGAWFAANVLTLNDGKALVSYTEIQSDEGSGKLKEWVPLKVEGTEAPKIRIAHPMTIMRFEGNRKRGRTVFTDYSWCSGDHVDVWVQDSWQEAVVVDTNKIDLTSLTVQFPAQGKKSVVRSWHVRPSLIWKDDKWIEWSTLKGSRSSEGDTPQEKRKKMEKEMEKSWNSVDLQESTERKFSFDVGKTSMDDKKTNTSRTMRSGLQQKERSRVFFGVPKPGKNQKFMDVSKHYVGDASNKNNNNSVKKDFINDSKEKEVVEMKSKAPKFRRKPPVPCVVRTVAHKDKSKNVKDSVTADEKLAGQQNDLGVGSSSNDVPLNTPKQSSSSQRLNKRKIPPGNGKPTTVEVKETLTSESEPRRSNRKIQPTSRLLEGLQSSLTISKMPSVSHSTQRSHKIMPKGSPKPG
ncbi:hypothetical protein L2E82_47663 [Cichorium intybus]|uniref:Uncharacterized protein n=1 Tax=Cichorium intybus TaxID=13427 RepID=A0ACB8YWN2_CICIN|nr:hypothetical protein L2E82_47663 [Cichorium intybus]